MRTRAWSLLQASLLLLLILGKPLGDIPSLAAEETKRQTEILVAFTQYEWWLMNWSENRPVCRVYVDHPDIPTPAEVETYCGSTLANAWVNTPTCDISNTGNTQDSQCQGYYLHFIGSERAERVIHVTLPKPRVWITLNNCDPIPLENLCKNLPNLVFIAEEPLPNEYIIGIVGTINGEPFTCPGEICEIPLSSTGPEGNNIIFWADSSYGDSSDQYQALVRVLDTGVTEDPEKQGYYVDVISTQWLGDGVVASCAQAWNAFPPIGGVPSWLANPDKPEDLNSTEPFGYLAGQLISAGVVDASTCPSSGLLENGWANTCGLEVTKEEVEIWQNDFDEEIINAAQNARIPSQLLKNLFAQESQFWPGTVDYELPEYGFGRMTELGADTVLLWNSDFYAQFCPLVLSESVCDLGYAQLDEEEQAILRGALAQSAGIECIDCDTGYDLSYSSYNIYLFAQTVPANCAQAGQIIQNATGVIPGRISTYEDLWKFTLVNYHAGPGCLSNAVNRTFASNQGMSWQNVASNLEPGCQTAILFVDRITGMQSSIMTPTPLITPLTTTPSPTLATPLPTQTTPISPTPFPTGTQPVTPYPGPTQLPTSIYPTPNP